MILAGGPEGNPGPCTPSPPNYTYVRRTYEHVCVVRGARARDQRTAVRARAYIIVFAVATKAGEIPRSARLLYSRAY